MGILEMLLGLPFLGAILRWCLMNIGIKDVPNLILKSVNVNKSDSRPSYRNWYHLYGCNKQRAGPSKMLLTKTAEKCHAHIEFRPSMGNGQALRDSTLIVFGPELSPTVVDVLLDRPFQIPIYWVSEKDNDRHPLFGDPWPFGYYIAGEHFIRWPEMYKDQHRLAPGAYIVTTRLRWENGHAEHKFELRVPAS